MIDNMSTAYKSAKAVQAGQKLWCMWAATQPFYGPTDDTTGFVVDSPESMRKMGADLFRLADAIDEINSMWEDET